MNARSQGARAGEARVRAPLAAACLAATALAAGLLAAGPAVGGNTADDANDDRPNIVVVMADDQDSASMRVMSRVNEQLGGQGTTFANNFVNFSLCCPSRSTFLTGQYAHNHGVLGNQPPEGGFSKLDSSNTLPLWLQQAGYYTGHVGKYLNGYEDVTPSIVPPGWTEWYGTTQTYAYYGYQLNENGTIVDYGTTADEYQADVFTRKAVDFVNRRAPDSQPFFLSVAYLAPHGGGPNPNPQAPANCANTAKPAPRHATAFDSEALPQPASFNEADVSDKPTRIQNLPLLEPADVADIQRQYRCRLESILGVDEGVDSIVSALRAQGELDETLFVYTADNGFMHGEHRIQDGKIVLYEPSIRVPLIMRGPGVPSGATVSDMTINADLAPTILDAANATAARVMDGESLFGAMQSPGRLSGRALEIETNSYVAVRTQRYIYAEHTSGENTGQKELYDLVEDPDELQNLQADPAFDGVEAALAGLLSELRTCSGDACRQRPALELKLDYNRDSQNGHRCAAGAVRVIVKGGDRSLLTGAEFNVGSKAAGSDSSAPFRARIKPGALKKRGKSRLGATASLLDGRVMTLVEKKVRRCR